MTTNQLVTKICIIATTISVVFLPTPSLKAQQNESFSLCVANLDAMTGVSLESAINSCKDAFFGRSPNEDYSVCVKNLDSFSGISVQDANQHCSEVFQNANQSQCPNNSRRTIIIRPGYPCDIYNCQ